LVLYCSGPYCIHSSGKILILSFTYLHNL